MTYTDNINIGYGMSNIELGIEPYSILSILFPHRALPIEFIHSLKSFQMDLEVAYPT